MYRIILSTLFVVSFGAKLDNKYLPPPPGAKLAGGNEDNLELPLEPPYIDQYTDSDQKHNRPEHGRGQVYRGPGKPQERYAPNQYGRNIDFDGVNNLQYRGNDYIENEDEIRNVQNSSFGKKGRFLSGSYSYTGPDNVLVTVTYTADNNREGRKSRGRGKGEEDHEKPSLEQGVVPTPSSLPSELQKAFDFHKKKHQPQDDKKGYQYGKPQSHKAGEENPEIDQGYSYPKQQDY